MASIDKDTPFELAARGARSAWLRNTTLSDPRWPLRQLHGLVNLLTHYKIQLVAILAKENSKPTSLYEVEFSILMSHIAQLIEAYHQSAAKKTSRKQDGHSALVVKPPYGVSLIITNTDNPLRYALAPLAASIAARNAVMLASSPGDKAMELLRRDFGRHVDSDTVHLNLEDETGAVPNWEDFDHVLICGDVPTEWRPRQSPHVHFLDVTRGYNAGIIDEGGLDLAETVGHVLITARCKKLIYDGFDAIFVHQSHFDAVSDVVQRMAPGKKSSLSAQSHSRLEEMAQHIVAFDATEDTDGFELALKASRNSQDLLMVKTNNVHHTIDLIQATRDLRQLVVLNPSSDAQISYISNWTRPSFLSLNGFAPASQEDAQLRTRDMLLPSAIFSPEAFSKPLVIQRDKEQTKPTSIEELRRRYEVKIPSLIPEPPGGRINFFVQAAVVAATTISLLALLGGYGTWYGIKTIQRMRT